MANRAQQRSGGRGQRTGNAPRARQPLFDPSQSLSGHSLKQAARSLTNLEIKPQISQLARQVANTNAQGQQAVGQVGGFYNQFAQQAQQANQAQQGIADRTNQTLAGIGQQTQDQIGQAGQQAQTSLQPLADKGLDGGSFARLASELAAQKNLAGQNAQTFKSFGATQGGNYQGVAAGEQGVGAHQAVGGLKQLADTFAQANVEPLGKIADLRASRGDLMAKNVGALRDSERNFGLAEQTLGVSASKAAADAADAAARRALTKRGQNITMRGQDINAQAKQDQRFLTNAQFVAKYGITPQQLSTLPNPGQWLKKNAPVYRNGGAASGLKPLTLSQQNTAFKDIDAATGVIKQLQDLGGYSHGDIRTALNNGYYIDGNGDRHSIPPVRDKVLLKAAFDMADYRSQALSRASVKALHAAGLRNLRSRYKVDPKIYPDTSQTKITWPKSN